MSLVLNGILLLVSFILLSFLLFFRNQCSSALHRNQEVWQYNTLLKTEKADLQSKMDMLLVEKRGLEGQLKTLRTRENDLLLRLQTGQSASEVKGWLEKQING